METVKTAAFVLFVLLEPVSCQGKTGFNEGKSLSGSVTVTKETLGVQAVQNVEQRNIFVEFKEKIKSKWGYVDMLKSNNLHSENSWMSRVFFKKLFISESWMEKMNFFYVK